MTTAYTVQCPECGQKMRVEEQHFGHSGKCTKCRKPIAITRESVTPSASAPASAPSKGESPSPAQDSAPAEWSIGDVILDEYEVTGKLGEGGMGSVLKVHHLNWDIDMAVKCPKPEWFRTQGQKENFVRECHTWMDLGLHHHIVVCHFVRVLDDIPRVFAEYVEGGSLKDWIDTGKLYEGSADEVLERILSIAIQFAWGLHYAHEKGLIHQDVKSANVMMGPDGTAKVTDFGLANARAATAEDVAGPQGASILASYGGMTPAYCSPEQAANAARHQAGTSREEFAKLTRRTDLYSWAVSVLEMLNGDVTWMGGPVAGAALDACLQNGPAKEGPPRIPHNLADLLKGCLAHNPDERPSDFATISKQLQEAFQATIGQAYPGESPTPPTELADVLNNKALSFLELGNESGAEALWQQALALDPHHTEATYNLGVHQWHTGVIIDEELVRRMEEVRTSHTDEWRDEYLLGRVHIDRYGRKAAISVLEEAKRASGNAREVVAALEKAQALPSERRHTLSVQKQHDKAACLSADGRRALSGDKTLRLWDVSAGQCVRAFESEHTGRVETVSLSGDARWALSGSFDKTLRLWDTSTGQCIHTLKGHGDAVVSACLSVDGRWVLSGSTDGTLRLWDSSTGQHIRSFPGHLGGVTSVCMSAGGRLALSGGRDKAVRLWNVSTGQRLRDFERHTTPVMCVCMSADGTRALSGSEDGTVRLWDLATGRSLRVLKRHTGADSRGAGRRHFHSLCLSADGRWAILGGLKALLGNISTGQCMRLLEEQPYYSPHSVCFSADGRWALVGKSNSLTVCSVALSDWEHRESPLYVPSVPTTPRGAQVNERKFRSALQSAQTALKAGRIPIALAHVADARILPGRIRDKHALGLWNRIRCRVRTSAFAGGWCTSVIKGTDAFTSRSEGGFVCLSEDGRYAMSGEDGRSVYEWDVALAQREYAVKREASHICPGTSGHLPLSGSWRQFCEPPGIGIASYSHYEHLGASPKRTFLSPDGRWLLCVYCVYTTYGSVNPFVLWERATGRARRHFQGDAHEVTCVRFSTDGCSVLTGSGDRAVRLWDLATGQCVRTLTGHTVSVHSLCLSMDGRTAASASGDKTVRLWDLANGHCTRTLEGHTVGVQSVFLSMDGRWVLSGGDDRSVRLWDVATGQCLRTFHGHDRAVTAVCLSANGRWVLSGSQDGELRLWELEWELDHVEPADWDEGARCYLESYLTLCTPYGDSEPPKKAMSEEQVRRALTRVGPLDVNQVQKNFGGLIRTLQHAGYGWLRPEGVKRELEKMAATWTGPPRMPWEEEK